MAAEWHLIQFTSDLRRREPRNIGIAATVDGEWAIRLYGANSKGNVVDSVRKLGLPKADYQQWVSYLHGVLLAGRIDDVRRSQRGRPTSFRVIQGGILLGEQSAQATADRLFGELVGEAADPVASPAKILQANVEKTLQLAHIQPTDADVLVPAMWGDNDATSNDQVKFDYAYQNGHLHFMDRLQLQAGSVDQAKMVARDFNARVTGARRASAGDHFIAFYSGGVVEKLGDAVLAPVWRVAKIIDVDSPGRASDDLRDVMTST